jgi:hypothetical protein
MNAELIGRGENVIAHLRLTLFMAPGLRRGDSWSDPS